MTNFESNNKLSKFINIDAVDKVFTPLARGCKNAIVSKWQTSTKTRSADFCYGRNAGLLCGKVNDLVVFDVDVKRGTHAEAERFITEYNLMDVCKYIIKTPSGGWHFFFKYTEEIVKKIQPTLYDKQFLDILTNCNYVVSEHSVMYDGSEYKAIKGNINKIDKIPNELIELYKKLSKDDKKKVDKIKKKRQEFNNSYIDLELSDEDRKKLESALFKELMIANNYNFGDYWFPYTVILKRYGLKKLWKKWSNTMWENSKMRHGCHPAFKEEENETIWKNINLGLKSLDGWNLGTIQYHHNIKYPKDPIYFDAICYKKITNKPQKTIEINRPYILKEMGKMPKDIMKAIDENRVTIVRSLTGSGKTTFFKQYIDTIKDSKCVSISSRVSLTIDQYKRFSNNSPHHWTNYTENDIHNASHLVTTIDSLIKFEDDDLTGRIVYLDEVSAIQQYLNAGHIKEQRKMVEKFFYTLRNAEKIICTDNDVTDACFYMFDMLMLDYVFVENNYKKEQTTVAYEMPNYDVFVEKMRELVKNNKKFVFASDNKKECETIYGLLVGACKISKSDVLLITQDETKKNDTLLDTDTWANKYIIYSPSIIYGVDFVTSEKYNVFVYISGVSIGPVQIGQQIFRCRNIEDIYLFYASDSKRTPMFYSVEDAIDYNADLKPYISEYLSDYSKIFEEKNDEITDSDIFSYIYSYYMTQSEITKGDPKRYIKETIEDKGINYVLVQGDEKKKRVKNTEVVQGLARISNEEEYEQSKKTILESGTIDFDEVDEKNTIIERLKLLNIISESNKENNEWMLNFVDEFIKDDYKYANLNNALNGVDVLKNPEKIIKRANKTKKEYETFINTGLGKLMLLCKLRDEKTSKDELKNVKIQLSKTTGLKMTDDNDQNTYKIFKHLKIPYMEYKRVRKGGEKVTVYMCNEELFKKYEDIKAIQEINRKK